MSAPPAPDGREVRLAILFDYGEEGWPSMDLAAGMLLEAVGRMPERTVQATRILPAFRRRATRLPGLARRRVAFNADRLANRFWDYPRLLRREASRFDLFHVADHTYAHLVHALPEGRAGVFCHDLDAFRCLIAPEREPRPAWFRAMARRTLEGLRKAAVVFHATAAVREQIERAGLLPPGRLVRAPLGVAPEFVAADGAAPGPPAAPAGGPFLLHVGSCIARKRIDVLLEVFARARSGEPGLRLVQVGGTFTPAQRAQVEKLGLGDAVLQLRGLGRLELARLYRGARALLLPSEAEGFGIPLVEALACGAPVVASDIPALREVGGEAAVYRPVGDVAGWVDAVRGLLRGEAAAPDRARRLEQAGRFTWQAHAAAVVGAYRRLAAGETFR